MGAFCKARPRMLYKDVRIIFSKWYEKVIVLGASIRPASKGAYPCSVDNCLCLLCRFSRSNHILQCVANFLQGHTRSLFCTVTW
eukprot:jgi/Botrbrau1/14989/Bobra.0018s0089.1